MIEMETVLGDTVNISSEPETHNSKSYDLLAIANIRTEVHNKGLCLSETWSELFNLLTKYQGELHTKENALIAKEISRDVLGDYVNNSDKMGHEVVTEENLKLKSELHQKDFSLSQVREELNAKTELLKQFQNEMLNKEHQVLRLQGELRQCKHDYQRLEIDLESRKKDLLIKDNLVDKIQTQMVKEISDLSDEVKLLRDNLEQEKQQHEYVRQQYLQIRAEKWSQKKSNGATSTMSRAPPETPEVIDIGDDDIEYQINEPQDFGSSYRNEPGHVVPMSLIQTSPERLAPTETADFGKFPTSSDDAVAVHRDDFHESLTRIQDRASSRSSEKARGQTFHNNDRMSRNPKQQTGVSLPSMDWFATSSEFVGTGDQSLSNSNHPITSFAYSNQLNNSTSVESTANMTPGTRLNAFDQSQSDSNHPVANVFTYSSQLHHSSGIAISSKTTTTSMNNLNGLSVSDKEHQHCENNHRTVARESVGDPNNIVPINHNLCKSCLRVFATEAELRNHETTQHRKGAFPCNVCGKSFTHPSNRHRHMLTHKGIQKHQCSVCLRKFSRRDNLQCHMASHYKINDDGSTLFTS